MPDAAPPKSEDAALKADDASITTVEQLVRRQLSRALGGIRGTAEGAVPTVGFTVTWIASHQLRLALGVSFGLAITLLLVRLLQRSTVQFVLNSLVGISIAALFALRSGRAEDAFLPGLIYNTVYAVVLSASALARWPLVGFMIGAVTGDPTGWRRDPQLVALCTKLTWLLAIPCFIRVVVQYPLWAAGEAGWLGVAKLSMGWPLQIAAFTAIIWVLNRDRTPVAAPARST